MGEREVAEEFFNQDHPRASITDDATMLLNPGQVLDNIATAMERVDLDISVEVSIDDDVAPLTELHAMVGNLMMGPTLAVHVVNTAMRIMSARYPADLVTRPLPAEYDLRTIVALPIEDDHHDIATTIFNQRTTATADLTEDDLFDLYEQLDVPAQLQIFMALFFMYGTKIGAMKHRTGIP
ncbi:hypothetical protein BAY61_31980 (plasmid) [Prauserella marina]|uniref:Uncharacterized protein n=1 Tax=Prauserella marina TaxID=530584 RepID=A0A222W119_9PSEU|nr:hypothetical protein [Prauserella marina]ASR39904.1 hypothetical protein BAY61_31980 [Prauserella marina]PWV71403.1 hypothetical protein DES30_112119 [Prauserella marina]SDD98430.1 hypothetical protein SAMN05421630_115160 [Prauserella marina]